MTMPATAEIEGDRAPVAPQEQREVVIPAAPTKEQERLHRLTHLPFEPRCPICVTAKAPSPPHPRAVRTEEQRQAEENDPDFDKRKVVQVDYAFLKTHVTDPKITVLTAFDVERGIGGATTVKQKGLSDGFPEKWLEEFLRGTGYDKITVQVDPREPIEGSSKESHRKVGRYTSSRDKTR